MTPDEEFEFSELLLPGREAARLPAGAHPEREAELLRRLLPVAERLELKLAYEIHAPMGPNAPEIVKVRDVYAELDSPLLGFVADFSSTMHAMSPTLLRAVRRAGLDDEAVHGCRRSGRRTPRCASDRRSSSATSAAATSTPGASARSRTSHSTCTATSTRASGPTSCRRSCTCTRSSTTSTSTARSPRSTTPELVRVFVEGGYRGYWSSEWEGHAFAEIGRGRPAGARAQAARPHPRGMRAALLPA